MDWGPGKVAPGPQSIVYHKVACGFYGNSLTTILHWPFPHFPAQLKFGEKEKEYSSN